METQIEKTNNVKAIISQDAFKKRFQEILGQKSAGFISSVINVANSMTGVEPNSIIQCAVIAATLDLPVDKNLGFSWLVPYSGKCQFQIGYKGLIQLALRSGQYSKLNVLEIYSGQLTSFNPLTEEIEFDFSKPSSGQIVGYAGYFRLINGFEKVVYWPAEKVTSHAKRFSKTYNSGPWQTDNLEMSKKTVLKNMLSKWGILSIEMQKAVTFDQSVVKDVETGEAEYIDNETDFAFDANDVQVRRNDVEKPLNEMK